VSGQQIRPGPRCGGEAECGKPKAHQARKPDPVTPWGWHDVQCQVPSADPRQYPGCGFIDGHESDHDYGWRIGTPERDAAEAQHRPPGGWPHEETAPERQTSERGSPYEWFYADVIRKPCPDCSNPTAVGFSTKDPGVHGREPARCVECSAQAIHRDAQYEAAHPGIRLTAAKTLEAGS
jgi:hypothetical protein